MTLTPVPDDFRVTWSHSSLETYKTCPLKYWAEKIAKCAPWEQNEKTKWGEDVHLALEERVGKGTPLPSNMAMYEPIAQKVISSCPDTHELLVEKKYAITEKLEPCDWFSKEAFGRCIADVVFLPRGDNGGTARVIDYKTGKYWGRTEQGPINAALLFCHYPRLEEVKVDFWYIAVPKVDSTVYTRDAFTSILGATNRRVEDLKWSVKHQNFPAKKNFLCRNFCTHFECPNNGRRP